MTKLERTSESSRETRKKLVKNPRRGKRSGNLGLDQGNLQSPFLPPLPPDRNLIQTRLKEFPEYLSYLCLLAAHRQPACLFTKLSYKRV